MSVGGEWNSCVIGNCDVFPQFIKTADYLGIRLLDTYYSSGKWMLKIKRDKDYQALKAEFFYEVKSEKESNLLCTMIQYDNSGNEICGDYLTKQDGFLSISIELQKNTDYTVFEFLFYSFKTAELKIYPTDIEFMKNKLHRTVNVATTCFKRKYTNNCYDNLEEILRIIDNASKDEIKPDIICFTETTFDRGIVNCEDNKWLNENSKPIKIICEKAKETGMYIIFGIHELENERKYNTDLIISPEGKIIGKYRKTHLTYNEINAGIVPGEELKVFDLPFGKIGVLICWDQWFSEAARELVKKGAEIIFVSTAGDPECIYKARAYENYVYTVVSGIGNDEEFLKSHIISQTGEILTSVTDEDKGYAVFKIDLDEHKYQKYLVFKNGYGSNMYSYDRRPEIYSNYDKA